jgi:hypothetical protein
MKKIWFTSLLLLVPILAGCQQNLPEDQRVVIPFADELKTVNGSLSSLGSYGELEVLINQDTTFILVVGNATCGCTVEFLPVFRQWVESTKIVTYYLEFTQLLDQPQKFGIPLVTNNVPILSIFDTGVLAFSKAYNPNRTSDNQLFYSLSLLTEWLESRIILPSFRFLSKTQFDLLFTTERKMIVYIGREDCPDCSYAFETFLVPFLKANPNLPTIYGLDVWRNGIRVPTVVGQESTTGNNTPGWTEFKTNYGLDNLWNTTFGYATGFVPTFMYIETNGQSIQANPLVIKDMIVTYNDSSRNAQGQWTTQLTRTFFDGSRPLQYTNLNLTTKVLPQHQTTAELRDILKTDHNQAMQDFFDYYLPYLA